MANFLQFKYLIKAVDLPLPLPSKLHCAKSIPPRYSPFHHNNNNNFSSLFSIVNLNTSERLTAHPSGAPWRFPRRRPWQLHRSSQPARQTARMAKWVLHGCVLRQDISKTSGSDWSVSLVSFPQQPLPLSLSFSSSWIHKKLYEVFFSKTNLIVI